LHKAVKRGLVMAAAVAGALAVAAPASAHVTVNPREATQGGYTRVVFRVPTESDTASTTKLEVHFPEDVPLTSARVQPVPGWTAEITREALDEPVEGGHGTMATERIAVITWTADDEDAALGPEEFGEFPVSMGPLPEVDQLVFPSIQTYSDGNVVRWIELPEEGAHPERPAPVLTLTPPADAAPAADDAGEDAEDEGVTVAASDEDSGGSTGVWLGLAGLIAGLAGLALGGAAFARARR
jgi:uncharacterized protein YcnI